MPKYILRRLLYSVVILLFVTFIIYVIMRSIPTSFVENLARERSMKPGSQSYEIILQQLNATYGMDKGILPGYLNWGSKAIVGNFGESWQFNMPVTEKFIQVIWFSFFLSSCAFIFEIFIAIPLGILAARKQYSRTDYAITFFALLGISMPTFLIGTVFKIIFGIQLKWVDPTGAVGRLHNTLSPFGQLLDYGAHYIFPILTITIVSIGALMRYTRTNMLEVLNSDYIRTARSKGLSEGKIVNYHAFRNTLIPIITILGSSLPGLFAGSLLTETVFQIPGIGYTSYQAMVRGDINFTMFYLTFLAILTLIGNLLADVLYAAADPRVRLS